MAQVKSVSLNTKFGAKKQCARNFIRDNDASKWIGNHKLVEIQNSRNKSLKTEDDYIKKTVQFAKDLFMAWDDDGSGSLEAEEII